MKATHYGHCQACGSRQKLLNGVLAKHGYTVEWSCFSGVCQGAGHRPFEQDYSLVASFIRYAEAQLVTTLEYIETLNNPAAEPTAWCQTYVKPTFRDRGGYKWVRREVFESTHSYDYNPDIKPYDVNTITVLTQDKIDDWNDRKLYYAGQTALDITTRMNQQYADIAIKPQATRLRNYIYWQTERVENWKPVDLEPVK